MSLDRIKAYASKETNTCMVDKILEKESQSVESEAVGGQDRRQK